MLAAGLSTSGPVPWGHQPRKVHSLIGNGCSLMDGVTATGEGAEALPGCLRGAGPLGNGNEDVCVTVYLFKKVEPTPPGLYFLFYFLATLNCRQDLCSPSRDQAHAPCSDSIES